MRLRAVLLASLLSTGCVECYGPRDPSGSEPATLRVRAVPESARLVVDDDATVAAQATASQPLRLTVGRHLITVEADGYFPHDLELDLPSGETTVDVSLRPLPP